MAVLTDTQRKEAWEMWMRENTEVTPYTKTQLRDAFNAVDDLFNTSVAAWNAALPTPFRTGATNAQKALVFQIVAQVRYRTGA